MLLQELKISNIRSYTEQTISFPEGTTLLSGDIGSGKSTILLAVEFALFGTSRPDLPAELLLRKGTTQGGVELSFVLNDDYNYLLLQISSSIKIYCLLNISFFIYLLKIVDIFMNNN